MLELNRAYNMDCMDGMSEFPDKYFDLAVVDPPYGGGGHDVQAERQEPLRRPIRPIQAGRTGGTWAAKFGKKIISWDCAPGEDYFRELFRVSKEQIIWGGNYFGLPPTRCFLVWRKSNIPENFTMAMCEYAWCSFNDNAKVITMPTEQGAARFHPTQKPVKLYDWIFAKYAKQGQKVLDTHLGSGASRIAAYEAGLDFIGFEIDKAYFDAEEKRFEDWTNQMSLFHMEAGT